MSETQTSNTPETREFGGVAIPAPGTFAVDPSHSSVQFSARHMMVSKVRGTFGSYAGTITVADDPLQSSVEISIDPSTIDTGDEGRDGHLQSADFFDVASHPEITFHSSSVRQVSGSNFVVDGELAVHGVTKEISLDVDFEGVGQDPWGGERVGFSTAIELDREDFGLTWNQALETGGVLVGKKVKIDIDIEAVRQ
jgi:polyisoprenoid-binding protein YceI